MWYNINVITDSGKTEVNMNYIDRIKMLKKEKKITTKELSELTEIPVGTLSKMLAGYSDSPKLSYVVAIATAFNVSLDYIICGIEENHNNYTLSSEEIKFVEKYRRISSHSKDVINMLTDKELELVSEETAVPAAPAQKKTTILRTLPEGFEKREIPLFDLPVSAGPGEYLDSDFASSDSIKINVTSQTSTVGFAVRVNGDSMEPKFKNGDILLVEETNSVEYGEYGIFILDGDGYFKKYMGDRLRSLNPEYGDILLNQFDEAICCGRVIGKRKRR